MSTLAPIEAHAGRIKNCVIWLLNWGDKTVTTDTVYDSNYLRFQRERKKNPNAVPPMREYDKNKTTSWELLTDFRLWWVPGNIWNAMMQPQYSELSSAKISQLAETGTPLPEALSFNPKSQWIDPTPREAEKSWLDYFRAGSFSSYDPVDQTHQEFDKGPEIDGTPASPDHGIYSPDDPGGSDNGGSFGNDSGF